MPIYQQCICAGSIPSIIVAAQFLHHDQQMTEIIEDYEGGGREGSGYVVMDVRGEC